ncbi:nucleotidyltransferase domain-containing protein [Burkholderia cenocepacia]|uniref:nucleotidyltransferase domain-containing protein n=1 Tax=Burkholderia cenocepacia TaxID=95486 RepID=UPI0007610B23|nr:nucleotidyltransferase domain-containing protein [Burkholderia cenocepacia]KWU26343.1 DNA polymerase III subunit beta [Burkholderia cenocepacia]
MSLADFMFSPGMQRVLAVTLPHPERSYSLRELIRLSEGGRGSSQKHIDQLVDVGVFQEDERRGGQRSIRANPDFALYPELLSIARKSFGVVEPLKEALEPFRSQIETAFVFGSVAKGTDKGQSDIDLMIIGRAALLELTEALHDAEQRTARPINFSLYTPDEWTKLIDSDAVIRQIAHGQTLRLI